MPSPPGLPPNLSASGPNPNLPQPSMIPNPASVHLPHFGFAPYPDILHKSPFLPYGMRGAHPMNTSSSTATQEQSSRLSPASSRNSSSSPPSNNQSAAHKINSSIELNSTNEQSMHSSSEDDSDDEHIDVVKSAFVPILRPTLTASTTTTNTPDSTVKEHSPSREIPPKIRCELKAPSSKKQILHGKAPDGPQSPDTKLKSPTITQQPKTVWRPY